MFFFDPLYLIFMIPAFILMGITSWYVKHAYNKWSKVRTNSGLTGASRWGRGRGDRRGRDRDGRGLHSS